MGNSLAVIKENKSYIILAGILFFLGTAVGVIFAEQMFAHIEQELGKIQDLGQQIAEKGSPLYASWVIFWNNLRAAIMFIAIGSLFGIVPIMGLAINGVLIGVVLSLVGEAGVSPILLSIVGLLPHGILEIPAILIAGGMGIKLGFVWLKPLPNLTRWESYKHVWGEVGKLAVLLFVLLLVAAFVEGFVTPLLIHLFIGDVGI
ncbi:stage II sporulation protein M [Desulfuribacillus alkaliarsenatis]|uniref:Stage II sporulation protein M n=1 Tax=Desulfuribacillus alkaliarsenatis TaxID=766136 RepID=A0A1E5G472_9FIRM|nr:stage II sporulation protein M [Desulfuribacillus alkaliarsenatis]OEF97896.1 hypothetical protein BHF68_12545 [Desulfuribacillus alkaliarsenatis]